MAHRVRVRVVSLLVFLVLAVTVVTARVLGPPPAQKGAPRPSHAPSAGSQPTLADYWEGQAEFVADVRDTGLPMGESDTLVMPNGEFWSYVHASQRSAGVVDRCGNPVEFPGCVVIYRSMDGGRAFRHDLPPVCLFTCEQCPCDSERDHIDQQQYPRIYRDRDTTPLQKQGTTAASPKGRTPSISRADGRQPAHTGRLLGGPG